MAGGLAALRRRKGRARRPAVAGGETRRSGDLVGDNSLRSASLLEPIDSIERNTKLPLCVTSSRRFRLDFSPTQAIVGTTTNPSHVSLLCQLHNLTGRRLN